MLSCRRRRKTSLSVVKGKRSSKDDDVDVALFTWFVDARVRITSAVLEEKANHFARALNKDFKAANGWLCQWNHSRSAF